MFTGIITNLGVVEELTPDAKKDFLLKISTPKKILRKPKIGCSIAVNGICLTLISCAKNIFSFQASEETCKKTTLKNWMTKQLVNLEFALKVGDEFGGHMVLGHVDAVVKIIAIKQIKNSHKFIFAAEKKLMKFIAEKGSVTLDGVSLTVNEVKKNSFSANIIPHTFANTNFKNLKIADSVNLEIDVVARYLLSKN